jgi:hypothetical protein
MRKISLVLILAALAASVRADCVVPYWKVVSTINHPADYVLTADFDGNGRADLAANNAATIFVARDDGNGALRAPLDVYSGTVRGRVIAAELTGDNKVDLAFAGASALIVLPGNGDGTFGTAVQTPVAIASKAIAAAHLDHDASRDLVALDTTLGALVLYTNNGSGGFVEKTRFTLRPSSRAFDVADLDADGSNDLVVGYNDTGVLDVFYGRADGTYQTGTIAGPGLISALHAADMDNNSLLDLISARGYYGVSILRSFGSRAFGDPLTFSQAGPTYDVAVADVTGDGLRDVIGAGPYCEMWSWTGTGLGTISNYWQALPAASSCYSVRTSDVAIGDFDADGRNDAVVLLVDASTSVPAVMLLRNVCGDSSFKVKAPPVVSAGKPLSVEVTLEPPSGNVTYSWIPTGDVSIVRGGVTLATGRFSTSSALTIPVNGLTVGEHALTAVFGGDSQYEPAQSPFTVRVTSETTTIAITADPPEGAYGFPPTITATLTASNGGTPTGTFSLGLDRSGYGAVLGKPPSVTLRSELYELGTYTFKAAYSGDATYPPSTATLTYVINKRTPTVVLSHGSAPLGQAISENVSVSGSPYGGFAPTGTLTVREGSRIFLSTTLYSTGAAQFQVPALSLGRHEFQVSYGGDAKYNAVETSVAFIVFPADASSIDAHGTPSWIEVRWWSPNQTVLRRKKPGGFWEAPPPSGCCGSPYIDTSAVPEQVYLYRMEGYDQSVGPTDVGMRISFTDDPLLPGKVIKAAHVQEIVRAANILRAAAGLPPIIFPAMTGAAVMTAPQLSTLRDAITVGRITLGATIYPFAAVPIGAPITATQLQELREAIR